MNTSLKAIFGLDSSNFRGELKRIERSLDSTASQLAKLGFSALGFQAVAQIFSTIVDHARTLEGELDANAAAAQRFARGLDEAKGSALDIGVEALGLVNRAGEYIGRQIAILKYGREQVELAEQITAEAEANIAAIEKAREAEEKKAKVKSEIAKLDERVADDLFKQLPLAEQRNGLEERYLSLVKEAINLGTSTLAGLDKLKQSKEVYLELQKTEVALQKESASNAEKARLELDKLAKEKESALDEEARKNIEIAKLRLKGVERLTAAEKVQLDLLEGKTTKRENEAKIAAYLKIGVEKLTDAEKQHLAALIGVEETEKRVTDEKRKQVHLAQSMVEITGRGSRDLTDRELSRKISILQSDIQRRKERDFQSVDSSMLHLDAMLQLQQRDLQTSLAELNFRRSVRSTASRLGEDAAFRQYSGLSESRFQEILRGAQDTNARLLKGIDSLNSKLDQGITVRALGR